MTARCGLLAVVARRWGPLALVAVLAALVLPAPAAADVLFVRTVGSFGLGAGQMGGPHGLAVDGQGNVYVADQGGNRIDEFSSSGSFVQSFGWGVADGQARFETCTSSCQQGVLAGGAGFDSPMGLAFDSQGNLYVADDGNHRVDVFSLTGGSVAFAEAFGWGVADGQAKLETCTSSCEVGIGGGASGQLQGPTAVAIGLSSDVYVMDTSNSRVDQFSSPGVFVRAWGEGVLDGQRQFETCTTSCQTGIVSGGGAGTMDAFSIATDSAGNVYVGDYGFNRIQEFSPSGAFMDMWGWGVADGQPALETCTSSCQAGIAGGGAGQMDRPFVAIDAAGDVYVDDLGNSRVDQFSTAGAFEQAWGWGVADGQPALETCTSSCQKGIGGSGDGQLHAPSGGGSQGVATDGLGNVFVSDSGDSRVEEYSTTGAPIEHTLSVSAQGSGLGTVMSAPAGIDCPSGCSAQFHSGASVTLTASPASGSAFAGWSGGGCSGTGTCTVDLTADMTVTATFTLLPPGTHELTIAETGAGSGTVTSTPAGIDCGGACGAAFAAGKPVTLNATPTPGSTFAGWSGGGCSGTGTCTVDLTADTTVTASFDSRHTLTVRVVGNGGGPVVSTPAGIDCYSAHGASSGTCSLVLTAGQQIVLSAQPISPSVFTGWSGGGCPTDWTRTCTVRMGSSDITVTAEFTSFPVNPGSASSNGSTVSGTYSCPAYLGSSCSETTTGYATTAVSHNRDGHAGRAGRIVLWRASFKIRAGHRRLITIKLTAAGRAFVRTHHRARVYQQLQCQIGTRRVTSTAQILLTYKPARHQS